LLFVTKSTFKPNNDNQTVNETDPCWSSVPSINRLDAYRLYVLLFNLTIGILVFYNLQKTKLLQMATTLMRWMAFLTMISLAIKKIHANQSESIVIQPKLFDIAQLPNFFGVCIYAFMCHHSLPSIITPMKNKEKYRSIFIAAYLSIMIFYFLLSMSGVFAFGSSLQDFYTLNFLPQSNHENDSTLILIIDYYLSLFPVFTISASFPIIGITLRNNLKSLLYFMANIDDDNERMNKSYWVRIVLPLVTLIPPMLISLVTHDLQMLVGFTGSYAGVAIQYIIPSCLVYFSRREAIRIFRENFQSKHAYSSPFRSKFWIFFVLLWANISIIFVTVDHVIKFYNGKV
jgi:amino acid permease